MEVSVEQQILRTAHHEAGHLVLAAIQGLNLRTEGLAVDAVGWGLACYCKQAGESDEGREKVIITTFAGYNSEAHFCRERDYPPPDQMLVIFSCDALEARPLISQLSYLSPMRTALQIEEELQRLSRAHIEERWAVISDIAEAVLAQEWEPIQPLPSGGVWAQAESAKYLDGQQVAGILASHGISAKIVASCS